jgi:hypothetical protein
MKAGALLVLAAAAAAPVVRRAILVALAVTFLAGCGSSSATKTQTVTVSAAQTTASESAPAVEDEKAWLLDLAGFLKTLGDAQSRFAQLAGDPDKTSALLAGNDKVTLDFALPVGTFMASPNLLRSTVGRPPSERLARIYRLVYRACTHYRTGGSFFARGVDNVDAALIGRATREQQRGTALMNLATAELSRIRAALP